MIFVLQRRVVPSRHKLDGLGRANASTRLAESAIVFSSRVVFLNSIERTDLDTLVAIDAGVFHLALTNADKIENRKQSAAWANITAPESSP